MNKLSFLLALSIFTFFFSSKSDAQSISGKVIDKESSALEFVAVAVINPSDSVLVSYTTTDRNGNFKLDNMDVGNYIFQMNLVGFDVYQKIIEIQSQDIDLGTITLGDTTNLLNEVVLEAIIPVSIKKDTISYNAKAFKIRAEDTAEDLLKKLPGVEVDASGNITAQGEEISKVYVDGKEFFSDDPKIATKNLSADAISSIEVIDEMSERARVTGINDSERNKIINIMLKDGKKVSDFGKAQGGYGTDDRYLSSLNYNRFTPKVQLSIIGLLNNINTTGADIDEIMDFSKGGRQSFGGGESDSTYGFLTTGIGGLNFGYEFKKDQNLNADYFYNYNKATSGLIETERVEIINDEEIRTEISSNDEDITNSHKANFNYRDRSKKMSSLSVRGKIASNSADSFGDDFLEKYNGDAELDLESIGTSKSSAESSSGSVSVNYTQRFKEASRRNIQVKAGFGGSNNDRTSSNIQENRFDISDPNNTYLINNEVYKESSTAKLDYDVSLEYTEPIAENHFIEFEVASSVSNQNDDVDQKNYENGLQTNPLIYQQDYKNNTLSGGVFYNFSKKDIVFNIGGKIESENQDFGLKGEENYNFTYTNFNPKLFFRYRPKRSKLYMFRAERKINLASVSQLTPVINNFNPLFIITGNPNLSPESEYEFWGMLNNFNFSSGFYYHARISYSYITDAIVTNEFTDNLGIRTTSYDNLGDKDDFNVSLRFGKRVESLKFRYNIKVSGGFDNYQSIINGNINETKSKNGTLGFSLENNTKDNIDASIGADFSRDLTTFTSGRTNERDYFQQSYFAKVDWNITNRLNIDSQFKYDIYKDSNFDSDQSVPIWNASMSYAFFKGNSLSIKLSALDILNRSIGLIRTSNTNYYQEINREVLGNYYMLSLTYILNAKNVPKREQRGGGHSRRGGRE